MTFLRPYNWLVFTEFKEAGGRKGLAFVAGTALALVSFAFFAWGMAHLWEPYTPSRPHGALSPLGRMAGYFWIVHWIFLAWRKHKSKDAVTGWWPGPKRSIAAPESDNARMFRPHASESGQDHSWR